MSRSVKGELDRCIKCGICTANCPAAQNTNKFKGPKHMGSELTRFNLSENMPEEEQVDYCCNCRNCELACPSGVKVSLLNTYYKEQWRKNRGNIRDGLLGRPEVLAKLGSFHVGMTNYFLNQELLKSAMEKTLGLAKRPLPQFQKQTFHDWFQKRANTKGSKETTLVPKGKVGLFVGCYTNNYQPQVGQSIVRILEKHGFEVVVPEQTCCGVPLAANGYLEAAEEKAGKNLDGFRELYEASYPIITGCPSCGLALKQEYQEMFSLAGVEKLSQQVYDFSEFLLELDKRGQLLKDFQAVSWKGAYHQPCHMKAQGIGSPALELLRMIPGAELINLDQGCCGLSGSYGFKAEKYHISLAIGEKLFNKVQEVSPAFAITECGGCGLQICQGSNTTVLHPAVIIEEAYKSI